MYRGTMAVSSGKWYYEVNIGANQYSAFGILSTEYDMASATNNWPSQTGAGKTYALYPYNGQKYDGTQGINYATANTSPAGSVYGVAFDLDNGTITFYKDGSSLGQAFTGISGTFAPAAWLYNQTASDSYNFGQRPFQYPPGGTGGPSSDYKSLCTQNLPDPLIADGSTAFDILTWQGDGSGARTVSGLNLSNAPDLVWSKTRNHGYHNNIFDSVRGYGTSATALITDYLGSANGGTLNSATASSLTFSGGVWHNENAKTYISWAWDGGDLVTGTYSSYDQSQHWSANTSGAVFGGVIGNLFDTATSTGIYPGSGGVSGTFDVTLTFSPGISCTSLRVYTKDKQSSATGSVSVNGGTHQSVPGNDSWTTLAPLLQR